jgi:hypothetical protein
LFIQLGIGPGITNAFGKISYDNFDLEWAKPKAPCSQLTPKEKGTTNDMNNNPINYNNTLSKKYFDEGYNRTSLWEY